MTAAHWFWTAIVVLVLLWYIIVTIIVTFKGGKDVLDLFSELEDGRKSD